jgi:Protein of unknown function (DUF3800)
MAVATDLKGYLDDSGSPSDQNHTFVTFGGFVSTVAGWDWFEKRWPRMLEEHNVPYLHMKELWNRDSEIYQHLKQDKEAEAKFLDDCTKAIAIAAESNITASVRLPDLAAFNAETGTALDPMALTLYGWIIKLREKYPAQEVQLILDKCDKPYRCIELAKQYAASDTYAQLGPDTISVIPLTKDESFKTVTPIQAADFCAWEARRHLEEHKTWNPPEESRKSGENRLLNYLGWSLDFMAKMGRKPRQRKSAMMLNAWPPADGLVFDYKNLMGAHHNRHKNGWVS